MLVSTEHLSFSTQEWKSIMAASYDTSVVFILGSAPRDSAVVFPYQETRAFLTVDRCPFPKKNKR